MAAEGQKLNFDKFWAPKSSLQADTVQPTSFWENF